LDSTDSLALTVSMDKSIKMTNTVSKNIIISYELETPSFCCEFHPTDPNYFYCGQEKSILMFDKRNTKKFVSRLISPQPVPIFSLKFVNVNKGNQELISASSKGVERWTETVDKCSYSPIQLFEGHCISLSSCENNILASFRQSKLTEKLHYQIFQLKPEVKEIKTLYSATKHIMLTRSTIFKSSSKHTLNPSPDSPERLCIAGSNQETYQCDIWDVERGDLIQNLPKHESPVLDMIHFGDGKTADVMCTLSENQISIHKLV